MIAAAAAPIGSRTKGDASARRARAPVPPVLLCPTRWYTRVVPTAHRRIQVTEDPELAHALRSAAPFLPRGLSRAAQVRELALAGARQLAERDLGGADRAELLSRLADRFRKPASAGIDWDALREGKRRAWRTD